MIVTMLSIIRDARRKALRELKAKEVLQLYPSVVHRHHEFDNPEYQTLMQEAIDEVLAMLAKSPDAQAVMVAMIEGRKGRELQKGMSKLEYANLRKKIRDVVIRYWRDAILRRKRK
jgi:hypothetical protein